MKGFSATLLAAVCGLLAFTAFVSFLIFGVVLFAPGDESIPDRDKAILVLAKWMMLAVGIGSGTLSALIWRFANQIWPNKRFAG